MICIAIFIKSQEIHDILLANQVIYLNTLCFEAIKNKQYMNM